MASLGTLFILLIIFFLLFPVIKLGWKIYTAQKTAKKAFSEFHKQQQQRAEEYESQQRRQQQRQRRKSMGEYVDFEEVNDSTQSSANPHQGSTKKTSRIKDEPLITDAEWEEIK